MGKDVSNAFNGLESNANSKRQEVLSGLNMASVYSYRSFPSSAWPFGNEGIKNARDEDNTSDFVDYRYFSHFLDAIIHSSNNFNNFFSSLFAVLGKEEVGP